MSEEKYIEIYNMLVKIIGINILGANNTYITGLCKCVWYLLTQFLMAAKNAEYQKSDIDGVKNYCVEFLSQEVSHDHS